jgi:hypothetical protein
MLVNFTVQNQKKKDAKTDFHISKLHRELQVTQI